MTILDRPRTAEQIAALPEGPAFRLRTTIVDGRTVNVPIAPDVVATWHDEADILGYTDHDGIVWSLGRYADGRWFRRR